MAGVAGTAATKGCGRASPPGTIAVAVHGDGDCLYNSVGLALLHAGVRHRHWVPGPHDAARAGNMRSALMRHLRSSANARRVLRGEEAPTGGGAQILRRLREERATKQVKALLKPWRLFADGHDRTRAELENTTRRITGGAWAYYPEVALLAQMFGVCITVYSAAAGSRPQGEHSETHFSPDGIETGPRRRCESSSGESRPRIRILNTSSEHFEPLLPCGAARLQGGARARRAARDDEAELTAAARRFVRQATQRLAAGGSDRGAPLHTGVSPRALPRGG